MDTNHIIMNIFGKNGLRKLKLGNSIVLYERHRVVYIAMLQWQHSWLHYLSALNQALPFVTL